jgi:hypothetical protein
MVANLIRNVKSLWATSPTFQAIVIAPPIFVGGYVLFVLALLVF